jgi:pimeloyl-ACP methyl ester carboxylesterase
MPTAGEIYYFASKNGDHRPALVLIHGAGGMHLHWPYNLRRLTDFRVFAPDLPGHGKSDGLGKQSIDKYAEVLAAWMDQVGIKKAVIAGHSMGGAIAQTLAMEYADKVRALILISTGAKLAVSPHLLEKLSTPTSTPAAIDLILKWSWAPDTNGKLIDKAREQMLSTRSAVIYGDYLACSKFDLTSKLKKISVPTQVIVGDNDKMTPLDLNRQLESGIKNANMTVIPDGGHMIMLEKPNAVAQAANQFLETLPSN